MQLVGNDDGGPGSVRLASAAGRWVLAVAVLGEAMVLLEQASLPDPQGGVTMTYRQPQWRDLAVGDPLDGDVDVAGDRP